MFAAGLMYWILNALSITVNIRNICVMLAPFFASNTALVTYHLAKEVRDEGTGLLAAAFIAIVPGYISRSVAGSFDNEGIAIFALLLTYWLWVKSVKTGSLFWSALCALAYYFMVRASVIDRSLSCPGYIVLLSLLL